MPGRGGRGEGRAAATSPGCRGRRPPGSSKALPGAGPAPTPRGALRVTLATSRPAGREQTSAGSHSPMAPSRQEPSAGAGEPSAGAGEPSAAAAWRARRGGAGGRWEERGAARGGRGAGGPRRRLPQRRGVSQVGSQARPCSPHRRPLHGWPRARPVRPDSSRPPASWAARRRWRWQRGLLLRPEVPPRRRRLLHRHAGRRHTRTPSAPCRAPTHSEWLPLAVPESKDEVEVGGPGAGGLLERQLLWF